MTPRQFRTARLDLNMSVAQMAEALQVTERTVYRWESGETPIPTLLKTIIQETYWLEQKAKNQK